MKAHCNMFIPVCTCMYLKTIHDIQLIISKHTHTQALTQRLSYLLAAMMIRAPRKSGKSFVNLCVTS